MFAPIGGPLDLLDLFSARVFVDAHPLHGAAHKTDLALEEHPVGLG